MLCTPTHFWSRAPLSHSLHEPLKAPKIDIGKIDRKDATHDVDSGVGTLRSAPTKVFAAVRRPYLISRLVPQLLRPLSMQRLFVELVDRCE
jgi:hypothetical protein